MQLILTLALTLGAVPLQVTPLLENVPKRATPPTQPVGTRADGIDVMQVSCVSKASLNELKAHFTEEFRRAGLYLAPEQEDFRFEKGDQVTGLDPDNLISYTAMLQPQGKLTTVVLAVAQLGMPKADDTAQAFAPVFPGAAALTTFHLEGVRAMTFSSTATPAQVNGFYVETMAKAGWQKKADGVFTKAGQQITVTVSPGTTERYVMLQLQTETP